MDNPKSKPFLKWAGNKFRLIDRINKVLPNGKRLVEPFCGSGAVFLNTKHKYNAYLLAEKNPDLINLFLQLKEQGDDFILFVKSFFSKRNNTKTAYIRLRKKFNSTHDQTLKSALFIYLNRHCYNGLCRYNLNGEFNVPFGLYDKPHFPEKALQCFHQRSLAATFVCQDFTKSLKRLRKTDVVYCDPPYAALSKTSNFTNYSGGGFSECDQIELAQCAEELSKRGIAVIISNHDTPFTRDIYRNAEISTFKVQRFISCTPEGRVPVKELLAVYRG